MGLFKSEVLSFDLSELEKLEKSTKTVCENLIKERDDLKKGLEQLRRDWNTPAGRFFFEEMDIGWEVNIEKFQQTMQMFDEVLSGVIREYKLIIEKANAINNLF